MLKINPVIVKIIRIIVLLVLGGTVLFVAAHLQKEIAASHETGLFAYIPLLFVFLSLPFFIIAYQIINSVRDDLGI